MSNIAIEQFLSDKKAPYSQGLQLYLIHGTSSYLKTLFKTENVYTRKKLREELQKIVIVPVTEDTSPDPVESKQLYLDEKVYNSLPEEVKVLHNERKKTFALMNRFRSQLQGAATVLIRKDLAFNVLSLEQQFYKQCKDLDFFFAHKQLPEEINNPALAKLPEAQLLKLKKSLTEKTSRYRNREDKSADMLVWKDQLNQINILLNAIPSN